MAEFFKGLQIKEAQGFLNSVNTRETMTLNKIAEIQ